ncbi:MAG TPA: tetratricopeptide repeat protein [Caulobacteraceae bacterium]|jgi:TPR repeat protein
MAGLPPLASAGEPDWKRVHRLTAIVSVAAVAVLGGAPTFAGPYDDGLAALERRDDLGAVRLFSEAAASGQAAAQYNLGKLYLEGRGVAVNANLAASWFRKAADQGNPGAQYSLGRLYLDGRGVRRDKAAAARWWLKAAKVGYVDAQVGLAALYAKGDGVELDRGEAAHWYREAASHGDAGANLDAALIEAEGPPPPPVGVGLGQTAFKSTMNTIFGAGTWRETGGYRSQARENQLRAEGALTVPVGAISHHSMGTPDAPGAYDIVVRGMTPSQAASRIRKSGVAYRRLFPEGSHGSQGAHLHVEPFLVALREAIWRRTEPGHTKAAADAGKTANPKRDAAEAISLLKSAAARGDVCASRALGSGANGEASAKTYLALQRSGSCG